MIVFFSNSIRWMSNKYVKLVSAECYTDDAERRVIEIDSLSKPLVFIKGFLTS